MSATAIPQVSIVLILRRYVACRSDYVKAWGLRLTRADAYAFAQNVKP
jgi:hypothetical protein